MVRSTRRGVWYLHDYHAVRGPQKLYLEEQCERELVLETEHGTDILYQESIPGA